MFSLSLLFAASFHHSTVASFIPVIWVLMECHVFAAVRVWLDRSWHFYRREMDTSVVRLLIHISKIIVTTVTVTIAIAIAFVHILTLPSSHPPPPP